MAGLSGVYLHRGFSTLSGLLRSSLVQLRVTGYRKDPIIISRCLICGYAQCWEDTPQTLTLVIGPDHHSRLPTIKCHIIRGVHSIPPNIDPDVARLQKSMADRHPVKHDGDRLIYQVMAVNYLHIVTAAFYITAVIGLYISPDIIIGAWENETLDKEVILNLMMLASGIVVLPVSLRVFARRLVLKLYHNEARNTYIAMIPKPILGVDKKRFKGAEVVAVPRGSFDQVFRLISFRVHGRKYFVSPGQFAVPHDYNKLMKL